MDSNFWTSKEFIQPNVDRHIEELNSYFDYAHYIENEKNGHLQLIVDGTQIFWADSWLEFSRAVSMFTHGVRCGREGAKHYAG